MSVQQRQPVSAVAGGAGQAIGAWLAPLRDELTFDSLVLGVIDPRAPHPDALLHAMGTDVAALQQWCDNEFRKDEMLREARRKGAALGRTSKSRPGPALPEAQHCMVHMLPIALSMRRAWYLAVGRNDQAYDETEQERATLALRRLHAAFDHVAEPPRGRMLLGEDGRLIHADPVTEGLILTEPAFLSELAETLPALVEQRWPDLGDGMAHDTALKLADRPRWVRLQRGRAVQGLGHAYWHLELRELDDDDIPPVGVVDDERIAQAVAYLSDHYAEAPTLADVAEAVHTSPFHFHRLFVRYVGRSPKHYLLRMQLMIAKWMLRDTRTSIGEIATVTGFASHGHFTATFHRMVGVSPSQYRESA